MNRAVAAFAALVPAAVLTLAGSLTGCGGTTHTVTVTKQPAPAANTTTHRTTRSTTTPTAGRAGRAERNRP